MATYTAISTTEFVQTADNNSIPQAIIPGNAADAEHGYAITMDGGNISAIPVVNVTLAGATRALIASESWTQTSNGYAYTITNPNVGAKDWIDVLGATAASSAIIETYLTNTGTQTNGSFTLIAHTKPPLFEIVYVIRKTEVA